MLKLKVQKNGGRPVFYQHGGGYISVQHLQQELFRRWAGRRKMLMQNIEDGVRIYEWAGDEFETQYPLDWAVLDSITDVTLINGAW